MVVVEDVVEVVVDDVDEVLVDEVLDVVVVTGSRSSESGEAVNRGVGFTPSRAFFITSEKIWAGNDPPVTARPWTLDIGLGSA